jgi:hypothetical protein
MLKGVVFGNLNVLKDVLLVDDTNQVLRDDFRAFDGSCRARFSAELVGFQILLELCNTLSSYFLVLSSFFQLFVIVINSLLLFLQRN